MDSEKQFLDLVSNLVPRANQSLAEQGHMAPLGLTYDEQENIALITASADLSDDLQESVNFIQSKLKLKVDELRIDATCLAYPDYDNLQIVCLLENRENYCAKYLIPVDTESAPVLVADDIEVEQSYVYIFPLGE